MFNAQLPNQAHRIVILSCNLYLPTEHGDGESCQIYQNIPGQNNMSKVCKISQSGELLICLSTLFKILHLIRIFLHSWV